MIGLEQIRPQSVATTPRQTRAMTGREQSGTSAANNTLASTNKKRAHQDPDEHDTSQSRQTQGNATKTGRLENLHQSSRGQPDDVNLQHAPQQQCPGSSQRQTRSMTQRYETQDANAEECHIENACKKCPYSAGTPPEPPSATQGSEIQNATQRKSQRLAERQQTTSPQANKQPRKPKGKKRQRPSEYKIHNNECFVRCNPLTLKIGQPLFGTIKRSALRELSMTQPSDAFNF